MFLRNWGYFFFVAFRIENWKRFVCISHLISHVIQYMEIFENEIQIQMKHFQTLNLSCVDFSFFVLCLLLIVISSKSQSTNGHKILSWKSFLFFLCFEGHLNYFFFCLFVSLKCFYDYTIFLFEFRNSKLVTHGICSKIRVRNTITHEAKAKLSV